MDLQDILSICMVYMGVEFLYAIYSDDTFHAQCIHYHRTSYSDINLIISSGCAVKDWESEYDFMSHFMMGVIA